MNVNFETKQKDLPFSILLNFSFWWTAAWWIRLIVQRRIFWYIWKQQKSSLHNSCNPNSSLSQTLFLPRSLLWCRYKQVDLKINETYKLKIEYIGKYLQSFKKINEMSSQSPQSLSAKLQFLKNKFFKSSGMACYVVG